MLNFLDRFDCISYKRLINDARGKVFTAAFGVQKNEKPFIAGSFDCFVLYVTDDYVEAQRVLRTLNAIKGGFVYVPYCDDLLLYRQSSSRRFAAERNYALWQILSGKAKGAVVCAEALTQPLFSKETFESRCFTLQSGDEIDISDLAAKLLVCGFRRTDMVSNVGEFAVRGDIFDVGTATGNFRLDFFGDEIESVREILPDGTGGKAADVVEITPVTETQGVSAETLDKIAEFVSKQKVSSDAAARLQQICGSIAAGAGGGDADSVWLLPFMPQGYLADYLPQDALTIWDEPKLLEERVDFVYREHAERVAQLAKAGEALPVHMQSLSDRINVFRRFPTPQLSFSAIPVACNFFTPSVIHRFSTGAVPAFMQFSDKFASAVRDWRVNGYKIAVLAGDSTPIEQTKKQFADMGMYFSAEERFTEGSAEGLLLPIAVEHGFISHTDKLVVVGTRDIGRNMSNATMPSKRGKQAFLSVEKGDYVVHDFHGIGLCEGIVKTDTGSGVKDFISVLYKNGDHLYVPVENSNLLTRYSGGDNPALSSLGGRDFGRLKEKVKKSIKEMSVNLLALYAARQRPRGFTYKIDSYLEEEFASTFEYDETEDQLRCIKEIDSDLSSPKIMDRLLVGDVGYGKTEVAMRAAFNVVANGKQVAVLAPTTILAEQHYKTFAERFATFDVKVECLNRFRTSEQQKKIVQNVGSGKTDIVIGTHRLLSKDVAFCNLGLLILDEEQRFGVEHKESLKDKIKGVDVLTMSATPIPRTLHMSLSGIRDISTITTPPAERKAVSTFVAEASPALIRDVITRETARGGQVFLLYNHVESIDSFARSIRDLVPDLRIIVAHGQMSEKVLEDSIYSFQKGGADVLISTTIIENGIDIPNANTLIVYDADTFGLAQLYQLRGRVGRSDRLAYAYFTYREGKVLSEVAYKRLSSVTEYSELGSGFKIAMKDLEIRGAGNVLGREQHGHIVKVGYDMYARLLKEAVDELKGVPKQNGEIEAVIETDLDAYAPDWYVASPTERMDFYRSLAAVKNAEEEKSLWDRTVDIYGAPPAQVVNLFTVSRLKRLCEKAGINKLTFKAFAATVQFAKKEYMMRQCVFDCVAENPDLSFSSEGFAVNFAGNVSVRRERLLARLQDFLQSVAL